MSLQKASEKMSNVADIRDELHDGLIRLAGPRAWTDTRESWIARGARKAGITPRTARSIFYREIPDPKWSVVEAIRTALRARDELDERNEASARSELAALRDRINRLEASMADLARAPAHGEGARDAGEG